MDALAGFLAAFFLPLFPLSMIFNLLFARVRNTLLRAAFLLAWPQVGLSLAFTIDQPVSVWILALALFTSVLYAFRVVGLREVGQWIGYLATSAWALLWIAIYNQADPQLIRLFALGFSVPMILLVLQCAWLEDRFGAAYTGLYGGLAQAFPRMSGVLVFVVLAIVATPLFPGFFAMLATITAAAPSAPVAALVMGIVWLLWSWAGVRLIQGLIVGPANDHDAADFSLATTWAYAAVLVALTISGLYITGAAL